MDQKTITGFFTVAFNPHRCCYSSRTMSDTSLTAPHIDLWLPVEIRPAIQPEVGSTAYRGRNRLTTCGSAIRYIHHIHFNCECPLFVHHLPIDLPVKL